MLVVVLLALLGGVAEASLASDIVKRCAKKPGVSVNSLPGSGKDLEQSLKQPHKLFTWEEMEFYNGEEGRPTYLVIDNNVYDFTAFLDVHPGGSAPLKEHAGKDASTALRTTGKHTKVYEEFKRHFKVGSIDL